MRGDKGGRLTKGRRKGNSAAIQLESRENKQVSKRREEKSHKRRKNRKKIVKMKKKRLKNEKKAERKKMTGKKKFQIRRKLCFEMAQKWRE